MQTTGLRLDQAPPLGVPATFFLTAPLAIVAADFLLIAKGPGVLVTGYAPPTLLLAHLGTLGFLAMVMLGAFYQMAPVVASAPIPRIRVAHLVHLLLLVGLLLLALRLLGLIEIGLQYAFYCAWTALVIFLAQVAPAMLRAQAANETVLGMRLALIGLFLTITLGAAMAHVFNGSVWLGPRGLWLQVHLGAGLLGWVGVLLVSISWQVIPMFYLAEPPGRSARRWNLILIVIGVGAPLLVLLAERIGLLADAGLSPGQLAGFAALPAVIAVWIVHPIQTGRSLLGRKRRRVDASMHFWIAGLSIAPLVALAAAAAHFLTEPPFSSSTSLAIGMRLQVMFVWLAVWGWAGLIVHGMLTRIVPFLVWFHRYSHRVGLEPTPSVQSLLRNRWSQLNLLLHLASLLLGLIAIWTRNETATFLTGLLLAATGLSLALALSYVMKPTRFISSPRNRVKSAT